MDMGTYSDAVRDTVALGDSNDGIGGASVGDDW